MLKWRIFINKVNCAQYGLEFGGKNHSDGSIEYVDDIIIMGNI